MSLSPEKKSCTTHKKLLLSQEKPNKENEFSPRLDKMNKEKK
jgi:hypothetical protein